MGGVHGDGMRSGVAEDKREAGRLACEGGWLKPQYSIPLIRENMI